MSERTKGMLARGDFSNQVVDVYRRQVANTHRPSDTDTPTDDKLRRERADRNQFVACWNAIEAHGGEADVVGEVMRLCQRTADALQWFHDALHAGGKGCIDSEAVVLGVNIRAWRMARDLAEELRAVLAKARKE